MAIVAKSAILVKLNELLVLLGPAGAGYASREEARALLEAMIAEITADGVDDAS